VESGQLVAELTGTHFGIRAAKFGKSGSYILALDSLLKIRSKKSETLKIWNFHTGDLIETLANTPVNRVHIWSQYDITLDCTTTSDDYCAIVDGNTVQLWQKHTSQPVLTFVFDADVVNCLLNDDLKFIVHDQTGRLHILHPNTALLKQCSIVTDPDKENSFINPEPNILHRILLDEPTITNTQSTPESTHLPSQGKKWWQFWKNTDQIVK